MLKPCPHRQAEDDGRITCQKIAQGDNEVSPEICRACPAADINCGHLRFTLEKIAHSTILVRYGNGRTEVWEPDPPKVALVKGACAARTMTIHSPADCTGCALRRVVAPAIAARVAERPQIPLTSRDQVA